MRRTSFTLAALVVAAACGGGDGGTGPSQELAAIEIVYDSTPIVAVDTVRLDAHVPVHLRALLLNASRQEIAPGTYHVTWGSSNLSVGAVGTDGSVTITGDGQTVVSASARGIADTAVIIVRQEATQVRFSQDTVVALTPGALNLVDHSTWGSRPLTFTTATTDAGGNAVASDSAITYVNRDTALFSIVPNATGDTVQVYGLQEGQGSIVVRFRSFTDTVTVQVAGAYRPVSMFLSTSGTVLSPDSVEVHTGQVVLFQDMESASAFGITGTGWSVGPIAPRSSEGEQFLTAGTFPYTAGSAHGKVVVTP